MTQKRFNGKAIYQPTGKAAEYSPWACNFYTGCSNDCEYCYCKRGVMSHVWSTEPRLKKCFKDEGDAVNVFAKEACANLADLRKSGILFSFTTDPLLPEIRDLTFMAVEVAVDLGIPVKVLTKRADWLDDLRIMFYNENFIHRSDWLRLVAFGFTLTGFDEKESGASTNQERIEAMKELHEMGFRTFASIEPVIEPAKSIEMIRQTRGFCDLYKIGLISGKCKDFYNEKHLSNFYMWLIKESFSMKIYMKDSILNHFGIKRDVLPGKFVNSDYNIFNKDSI